MKNPFEPNEVVGITNYVDLGFEFEHRCKLFSYQASSLLLSPKWYMLHISIIPIDQVVVSPVHH